MERGPRPVCTVLRITDVAIVLDPGIHLPVQGVRRPGRAGTGRMDANGGSTQAAMLSIAALLAQWASSQFLNTTP